MTQDVREVVDAFRRLPAGDQQLAIAEILKTADDPSSVDEILNHLAEERFLALDAEEAAHGHAESR